PGPRAPRAHVPGAGAAGRPEASCATEPSPPPALGRASPLFVEPGRRALAGEVVVGRAAGEQVLHGVPSSHVLDGDLVGEPQRDPGVPARAGPRIDDGPGGTWPYHRQGGGRRDGGEVRDPPGGLAPSSRGLEDGADPAELLAPG